MACDATTVARLDELMIAIRSHADPRRAEDEWRQVYRLLQKAGLPSARVTGVVGMRDVARLAELVDQLRSPASLPPQVDAPSADACRQALRAFRKRQSVTRLDDESKLGRSPLSKGPDSRLAAITPPNEWPESVWQELVRQGSLRYIGHGLYELTKA